MAMNLTWDMMGYIAYRANMPGTDENSARFLSRKENADVV